MKVRRFFGKIVLFKLGGFMKNISGRWEAGWALDVHTIYSTPNPDGTFNNVRTPIGEAVYQLKYNQDFSQIDFLVQALVDFLKTKMVLSYIDVIIATPPSQNRDFQPVFEIASRVASKLGKSIDFNFVLKTKPTTQLKSITDINERQQIISGAFAVSDPNKYRDKKVLIIDDLYRSGTTLNEISKVLYEQAYVNNVYVVTLTHTRSNR